MRIILKLFTKQRNYFQIPTAAKFLRINGWLKLLPTKFMAIFATISVINTAWPSQEQRRSSAHKAIHFDIYVAQLSHRDGLYY